jgi:hypothetical protein
MPLYFIDSSDGERSDHDDIGLELTDDGGARRAALDALADMVREVLPDGDVRTFSVHVRAADGTNLYHAEMSLRGQWIGR